jgi:hypothetical protein
MASLLLAKVVERAADEEMEENLREEATGAKAGARADARSKAGRAMRFIVFMIYADVWGGTLRKIKIWQTAREKASQETKPHEENIFADIVDLIADVSIEQNEIIKIKIKIDKQS